VQRCSTSETKKEEETKRPRGAARVINDYDMA
jgi:hypothetical protein